jgi:hypothetical protein
MTVPPIRTISVAVLKPIPMIISTENRDTNHNHSTERDEKEKEKEEKENMMYLHHTSVGSCNNVHFPT